MYILHSDTHIEVARLRRAPPPPACVSAGSTRRGALTVSSGWASRPPSAAPRARCRTQTCVPPCGRHAVSALVTRAPVGPAAAPRTRPAAWHATTSRAAAAASPALWRGPAPGAVRTRTCSSAAPASPCTHGGGRDAQVLQELARAERLGERLHLRGGNVPAMHCVCVRPAPAAHMGTHWFDLGSP